jgi:hypothetical protein
MEGCVRDRITRYVPQAGDPVIVEGFTLSGRGR